MNAQSTCTVTDAWALPEVAVIVAVLPLAAVETAVTVTAVPEVVVAGLTVATFVLLDVQLMLQALAPLVVAVKETVLLPLTLEIVTVPVWLRVRVEGTEVVTVMVVAPVMVPDFAVMVAVPTATAVARPVPESMVAMLPSAGATDQLALTLLFVLPSSLIPVALNC
jgi:hypothetical protein